MRIKITQIQPQKRNKNRVNLFTEEGFLTSLSYDSLLRFHIVENGDITEEELEQAKKDDTLKYAKEQAMNYVARAPKSQKQVEKNLEQKGIDQKCIEQTIKTMQKYGYIDDAFYARELIRSYQKKLGQRAIRQKLRQNGIDERLISQLLDLPEQTQFNAARKIIIKQSARYRSIDQKKARQRMYAMLVRRGFSGEIIRKAMEEENFALYEEDMD